MMMKLQKYCFQPSQDTQAMCAADEDMNGSGQQSSGYGSGQEGSGYGSGQEGSGYGSGQQGSGSGSGQQGSGSGSGQQGSSTCRCGVKKTARIVGGTEVDPKNKYPW